MANRSIGVQNAPGVRVEERNQALGIEGGELGSVGYVGILERGDLPEGESHGGLIGPLNSASFARNCGGRIKESELPAVCQDFFRHSDGNGRMFLVRLGDGTQTASEWVVTGRFNNNPSLPGQETYVEDVLKIKAKNSGIWGGKRKYAFGSISEESDLSATYIETGEQFPGDFWKDGTLRITDDTSGEVENYKIIGNTPDGNVIVSDDHSIVEDFESIATTLTWEISVPNKDRRLSVNVVNGSIDPINEFGIIVRDNGNVVKTWDSLSLDPDASNYVVPVINDDPTNYYIDVEDLWEGGEVDSFTRPAAWCGYAISVTPTELELWPVQYKRECPSGAGGTAGGFQWGEELVRDKLKVVFADDTNYAVTSDRFGYLGAGVVGEEFSYNDRFGIRFVMQNGDIAFAQNDIVWIRIQPLELENNGLAGGKAFVNIQTHPNKSVAIKSNTVDTLQGRVSGDFTQNIVNPVAPLVVGTEQGTFDITQDVNDIIRLSADNGVMEEYQLNSGNDRTASEIAEELNNASEFNGLEFDYDSQNRLTITSRRRGAYSGVGVGDGTANAVFGLTGDTFLHGTNSTTIRLEGFFELEGGSDGIYGIDESNFELAFDIDNSPFNEIEGMGQGLVKFATPGWTNQNIQNFGAEYATSRFYTFQYEIPASVIDEVSAEDWCDAYALRNGFTTTFWPSQAYVPNPDGSGRVLRTLTGQIQGIQARRANEFGGYHGVGAGLSAVLPNVISFGDRRLGRIITERPDMEYLNSRGINSFKKIGNRYHVWGARTLSNSTVWRFAHIRNLMSHYERVLLESFDWALFQPNNEDLWSDIIAVMSSYFSLERQKGALAGASDEEAFFIKVDSENNTEQSMNQGDLNVYVELRLPNIVERVIISVGRMGINESIA